MAVRQHKRMRKEFGSNRSYNEPTDEELARKRKEYLAAKDEYELACVRKHPKPSFCEELGKTIGVIGKGVLIGAGHVGRAGAKMGELVEEDLYRRSPAGERDKAIVRLMMEKNGETGRSGKTSSRRRSRPVVVRIDGKEVIVDQSDVFMTGRRRSR